MLSKRRQKSWDRVAILMQLEARPCRGERAEIVPLPNLIFETDTGQLFGELVDQRIVVLQGCEDRVMAQHICERQRMCELSRLGHSCLHLPFAIINGTEQLLHGP